MKARVLLCTLGSVVLGSVLFFVLLAIPAPDKPGWFLTFDDYVKGKVGSSKTHLDDEISKALEDALKTQYNYELGPHRKLHLLNPPQVIDWSSDRPSQLYDYADTIPSFTPYYQHSSFSVYQAYGRFLDSVDLKKLAKGAGSDWLAILEATGTYEALLKASQGIETPNASRLRHTIEQLIRQADERKAHDKQSNRDQAIALYTQARFSYRMLAYLTNVQDSESSSLRPSYKLSPQFKDWLATTPVASPGTAQGETTVELAHVPATAGGAQSTAGSTLSGVASVKVDFKRIGKLDVTPGGWFNPYAVRHFADASLRQSAREFPMWGPKGDFPLRPVAFIVAEEPSVQMDLAGIDPSSIREASTVTVGPLNFASATSSVVSTRTGVRLQSNPNRVYLVAVVTEEMPFIQ